MGSEKFDQSTIGIGLLAQSATNGANAASALGLVRTGPAGAACQTPHGGDSESGPTCRPTSLGSTPVE